MIELPVLDSPIATPPQKRAARPEWLKVKIPQGEKFSEIKSLIHENNLHTVCEEARCPNMAECWSAGTATFMILGDTCTRSCGFCAVKTGRPQWLDRDEPEHVADAVRIMKLRHAVITSVNRDELPDGGATMFAETVRTVRRVNPNTTIEVLIPDFKAKSSSLEVLFASRPDILGHNTETVPSLYRLVRPQAKYHWTLSVLSRAKEVGLTTKTGIMLGLGETREELMKVMLDLVNIKVEILTLGQYLQPTSSHVPVNRFVHPDEFKELHDIGLDMGFRIVESGPLVRSSYHSENHV